MTDPTPDHEPDPSVPVVPSGYTHSVGQVRDSRGRSMVTPCMVREAFALLGFPDGPPEPREPD